MADIGTQKAGPEAFLIREMGVYDYRPIAGRVAIGIGVLAALCGLFMTQTTLFDADGSTVVSLDIWLLLLSSFYLIWVGYVQLFKFKQLIISDIGIKIKPYGFEIPVTEIASIHYGSGANGITIWLKKPKIIQHLAISSWGRKMTLSFNPKMIVRDEA